MAASMWRMNGFWRRMAELLVLSALLLSNEVTCQSEAPITTAAAAAASPSAVPDVTASGQPAAPTANAVTTQLPTMAVTSKFIPTVVFGDISVVTGDLSQNENEAPAIKKAPEKTSSSSDSSSGSSSSKSPGSPVFVGILVSGLLAALAIIVGYFKCQRRSDTQCVKLAEEAYPVDQENQGNTLVSVAPLNPPPETQEKPSINGESTEPAKTEPPAPPTNGHSTAKTADTEL